MDEINTISLGASGGIIGIILVLFIRYCYKKELHTKCKSACCETSVDVEDNSSPIK
jgi:hypothetical protein